jgi:HK97 gp10 family phage protein
MARTAKEINDKLRRLVNEQKKAVDQALLNDGAAMVTDVKSSMPKRTGKTAAEYDIITKTGKSYPFLDEPNTFYKLAFKNRDNIAFYQEFGTVKDKPQPTIRPAWSRNVSKIKAKAVGIALEVLNKYK